MFIVCLLAGAEHGILLKILFALWIVLTLIISLLFCPF
ncbi:hypothetical protein J2129_001702 [Methanofollis sp. W23]|nr:hypothetical protein [Methanofollis sp. W23]